MPVLNNSEKKSKKKEPSQTRKTPEKPLQESWQIPEEILPKVLKNLKTIIKKLAPVYKWGPHEAEDLETEALQKINKEWSKYTWREDLSDAANNRKLYNFMFTLTKNHFINMKRNGFARPTPPCTKCPLNAWVDKKCTLYDNDYLEDCEYYRNWILINQSKSELQSVFSGNGGSCGERQLDPLQRHINEERLGEIREQLSDRAKRIFDRVLMNEKVGAKNIELLLEECQEIKTHG